MRNAIVVLCAAATLCGCASKPQSGSWVSRDWNAVEQEVEEVASAIGNEAMRHYAATAILAVLAVGCWTRVRAVSRKHAETTDDSSESGDA